MFQQVVQKGGELEINYIKIFQNTKDLAISVGYSYTEDQPIHTCLEKLQQHGKYSDHIASHQKELRREEKPLIKSCYPYLTYKWII